MKIVLLKILILLQLPIYAQNIITGNVKDLDTKEGLPSCSIFINNSTIGTTSNQNGDFIISNILLNEVEIVFRYVGYESYSQKINFTLKKFITLEVALKPSEKLISEVEIKAKRDVVWEKQIKKFKLAFLGNSMFAKECEILNPWILNFQEINDELSAKASQPLKIVNNALGYEIEFEILTFSSKKNEYKIQGRAKFKEQNSEELKEKEKWKKNRETAYQNSPKHFFNSLINNKLEQNGFVLYTQKSGSTLFRTDNFYDELNKSIIKFDASKSVGFFNKSSLKKITFPENLEVHNELINSTLKTYKNIDHAVSWVTLKNNNSVFNTFGEPQTPSDIVVSGEMNQYKFSGLLPLDYQFERVFSNNKTDSVNLKTTTSTKNKDHQYLSENIIIHTNKHIYRHSETIWFRTHQYYPNEILEEDKSGVVYIDLVNNKKEIIFSKVIKSINGNGWGEFQLSDTLTKGKYCIRAYTNWMRNFGDSLQSYLEVKIIDKNEDIPFKLTLLNKAESNWLVFEKDSVKSNQIYKIRLKAKPSTSYSVTILQNNYGCYSQDNQYDFTIKKNVVLPIKYPKERQGRVFEGFVPNNSNVNIMNFGNNFSNPEYYQSNEKGEFSISNVVQNDTIKINLLGTDTKGKFIKKINLSETKKPPFLYSFKNDLIPSEVPTNKTEISNEKSYDFDFDKVITLDEIEIKGVKAINPLLKKERKLLGNPNLSFSSEDLLKNSSPNVLMALVSLVPTLKMVYNADSHSLILSWTKPGLSQPLIPKIWLDGFEVTNPSDLQNIQANSISKIDFYKGPVTVANAQTLISIYTKTYLNDWGYQKKQVQNKNSLQFLFLGFSFPKVFYLPNPLTDINRISQLENRSTIYWNPNVFTDEKGDGNIDFFVVGKPGLYNVEVVGLNQLGNIEKQTASFVISK